MTRALDGRTARRGAWITLLTAGFVLVATAAYAVNEPVMSATFPRANGSARSLDLSRVTATYDRDLSETASRFRVLDNANVEVAGTVFLTGPKFPTGGQRTIAFQPIGSDPLVPAESPYRARVVAAPQVAGDATVTEWTFTVDDTPPGAPVITSPTASALVTEQPVVAAGTTESGAFVEIIESGSRIAYGFANGTGGFSIPLPYPPEDGVHHTISAIATDAAGNRSATSTAVSFRHDSVTRIPVITAPENGSLFNVTSIRIDGNAKPNTQIRVHEGAALLGTTTADGAGQWSTTLGFAAGSHSITARSWDGYVLDGPSPAVTFVIDTAAPAKPVIQVPAASSVVGSRPATISGTAEPNSTVQIRESGLLLRTATTNTAGAWSTTFEFTDGSHTITARAFDQAGNQSSQANRTFFVDTTAPVAPVISLPAARAYVGTSSVTVAGTAEQNQTVRIFRGTVQLGTASVDSAGNWSTSIVFSPDSTYTIRADVIDAGGNIGPASAERSFTVDTVAPDAPVIISPFEAAVFSSGTVSVSGTAEQGNTVRVSEGSTVLATTTADSSGDWFVVLNGLADGPHTITAQSEDRAAHLSPVSAARTFTVDPSSADTTPPGPPTITYPTPSLTTGPFVIIRGSAEPFATVFVSEGGELGSSTANGSGDWAIGLEFVSGAHTIVAVARDRAGNIGPPSPSRTFTVDAVRPVVNIDTTPDTVFLPTQPAQIDGWASDDNGVAYIELQYFDAQNALVMTRLADCTGCPGTPVTWRHMPTLVAPGIYRVQAVAVDTVGNRSRSHTISIYRL